MSSFPVVGFPEADGIFSPTLFYTKKELEFLALNEKLKELGLCTVNKFVLPCTVSSSSPWSEASSSSKESYWLREKSKNCRRLDFSKVEIEKKASSSRSGSTAETFPNLDTLLQNRLVK